MGLRGWWRRRRGSAHDPATAFGTAAPPPESEGDVARRVFGGLAAAMVARRPFLPAGRARRASGPVDRPPDAEDTDRLVGLVCGRAADRDRGLRDLRRLYADVGGIVAPLWQAEREALAERVAALAAADRERSSNPLIASGLDRLSDPEAVETELGVAERVFRRLAEPG